MKILITGIHGFVGSNLVEALKKEHTIYGLDIISPSKEGVKFTFGWDNLDDGQIPEVDAIIHLAGKAHDTKNQSAAEVYFKVNTGLTQRIFDYFLAHEGIKKFVFFSTAKAAADKVEGVLTEDVVPAPVGPYGESKIKAEEYILDKFRDYSLEFSRLACSNERTEFDRRDSYKVDSDKGSLREKSEENLNQNHQEFENLRIDATSKNSKDSELSTDSKPSTLNSQLQTKSVYIFRPCMIHGPGNKGNLNLLYNVVRKGIPWPLGAFENRRTFTSVENICFAVNGVLTKDVPSGIYNMGDDEALSTNELIEEICKSLGKKAHIWKLPKGLMNGVA